MCIYKSDHAYTSLVCTCTFTTIITIIAVQEVTDAEGRRRFHGAFTGGYSAGFYNTVGSLEGWEPKTFKSSREQRAGDRYADIHKCLDYVVCMPHACNQTSKADNTWVAIMLTACSICAPTIKSAKWWFTACLTACKLQLQAAKH